MLTLTTKIIVVCNEFLHLIVIMVILIHCDVFWRQLR